MTTEAFEDRVAKVGDVHKLVTELRTYTIEHEALGAARAKIDDMASALDCAETCEVESDLEANLTEARELAKDVESILTTASRATPRGDLETIDDIADARRSLGQIVDELLEV
ncbi:MAG: hypothetical protein ACHREM_00985 [Polyangiales bacterium]